MSVLVNRHTEVITKGMTGGSCRWRAGASIAAFADRLALMPSVCATLVLLAGSAAHGQETTVSAVERFFTVCGGNGISAVEMLPGEPVSHDETPSFFGSDVRRSGDNHRVTRTDNGFAMRAVMQGDADPNSILVKCAFATDQTSYDRALSELADAAGTKPYEAGGEGEGRRAMFMSADAPFQIFEESDGWVSIYRMDILISARGIDPKYLKEGAQPVPIPQVR